MEIIELPKEFIGRGSQKKNVFKLYMKSPNAYIYLKNNKYYEVFERKLVHLFNFETKQALEDMKVRYPKDKDFGKWAWCYLDEPKAKRKLFELNEKAKNNIKQEKQV